MSFGTLSTHTLMDRDARNWMLAQTWPDVRPQDGADGDFAYRHPYGFIVVRLAERALEGWNLRLHLWPKAVDLPCVDQRVHSHGWDLVSRTLIGSISHEFFEVQDAREPTGLSTYLARSTYTVGSSTLKRDISVEEPRPTHTAETTPSSPLVEVRNGLYHSAVRADATKSWAVTLVATSSQSYSSSMVIAPDNYPEEFENERAPIGDLSSILAEIDPLYVAQSGEADRWVSSVFLLKQRNVLVVRTFRFPEYWQPVGGQASAVDASPIETAERELSEETGLTVDRSSLRRLGSRPRDRGNGQVHAWVLPVDSGFTPKVPNDEIAEVRWVTVDELIDLPTFQATHHFVAQMLNEVDALPETQD